MKRHYVPTKNSAKADTGRVEFGDCLTYAVAKLAQEPLLCVGQDFVHTDLPLADY